METYRVICPGTACLSAAVWVLLWQLCSYHVQDDSAVPPQSLSILLSAGFSFLSFSFFSFFVKPMLCGVVALLRHFFLPFLIRASHDHACDFSSCKKFPFRWMRKHVLLSKPITCLQEIWVWPREAVRLVCLCCFPQLKERFSVLFLLLPPTATGRSRLNLFRSLRLKQGTKFADQFQQTVFAYSLCACPDDVQQLCSTYWTWLEMYMRLMDTGASTQLVVA